LTRCHSCAVPQARTALEEALAAQGRAAREAEQARAQAAAAEAARAGLAAQLEGAARAEAELRAAATEAQARARAAEAELAGGSAALSVELAAASGRMAGLQAQVGRTGGWAQARRTRAAALLGSAAPGRCFWTSFGGPRASCWPQVASLQAALDEQRRAAEGGLQVGRPQLGVRAEGVGSGAAEAEPCAATHLCAWLGAMSAGA
jgi:hypothetical protein